MSIPKEQVHAVCNLITETCQDCPARLDVPGYKDCAHACYEQAENIIKLVQSFAVSAMAPHHDWITPEPPDFGPSATICRTCAVLWNEDIDKDKCPGTWDGPKLAAAPQATQEPWAWVYYNKFSSTPPIVVMGKDRPDERESWTPVQTAPSSAVTEERRSERAWLVESVGGRWGTGFYLIGIGEYDTWGTLDKAIRFVRKEDAERVIESLHGREARRGRTMSGNVPKYEACEHEWPSPYMNSLPSKGAK